LLYLIIKMNKTLLIAASILLILLSACEKANDYDYKAEYMPVQLQGSHKWSILDLNSGEVIAKDAFEQVPSAVVKGMFYVMNEEGTYDFYNVANPTKAVNAEHYGSVTAFSDNGFALASRRGGPIEVIDTKCHTVRSLPKQVAHCMPFSGGMATYQNDQGLWGYINEQGDTVIAAQYQMANSFRNADYAIVIDANQPNDTLVNYSVIDKTGKNMFSTSSAVYQLIQPFFVNDVLPVIKGDTLVCLNREGHEVPNPNKNYEAVEKAKYNDFSRTAGGLYLVVKNNKMGLVDNKNQVLIEPKYDRLADVSPDRYLALTDTVCQLVDRKGQPVGNAKFVHVNGDLPNQPAVRGFIDTDIVVSSLLMLFGPDYCCGTHPGSTLMDMNSLLADDPKAYVGSNSLGIQQGPFMIGYKLGNNVASETPNGGATYNYDAKVECVGISINVAHCGLDTERQIVEKTQSVLGTRGFVLEGNNIFSSEAGTALTMGYNKGIVNLYYFMNRSLAHQLPRNLRK
ncbi:MAG: WG repeat-containing protein, partial [Muribaculaceae bacterium]|nr:WG repeat-containing protein [Muribaculaceae bacterium]